MAEPTTTRVNLRRSLCQALNMPFYKRTGGQSLVGASSTTTSIIDTKMVPENDFWNGQWWYSIARDEVRKITDTVKSTTSFTLEYACTTPTTGDAYEIHCVFNAFDLHNAINRAISDAFPAFFDYVTDETTVLKEDTLKYTISGLTQIPWMVYKVCLEHNDTKLHGTATAGAATSIADTANNFTSVSAGWLVSIYAGTGSGQLRTVSSVTGTTQLNVSLAWVTNPDTTSKYAVWNPDSQLTTWETVVSAGFDAKEYPNYLYLNKQFPASIGMRIRLEYTARPLALTTDAGATVVPEEFIIHKAQAILYGIMVNDNRADRNRYANLEEYHRQLAEQYRTMRAFQIPNSTIWEAPISVISSTDSVNPF